MCALIGVRRLRSVAYVRTVKTASGATAVQIVWSSRRGSREIEHLGSAHDEAELEALKAAARGAARRRSRPVLDLGAGGLARRVGPVADRLLAGGAPVGRVVPGLRRARLRPAWPAVMRCSGSWCWPGSSSRPASSTAAGAGRGRCRRAVVRDAQASAAGLRQPSWRQRARRGVRRARGVGAGVAGALRRVDAVLRDRPR